MEKEKHVLLNRPSWMDEVWLFSRMVGVSPNGLPPMASLLLSSGMMPQFLSYVYSQYPRGLPSTQGTTPFQGIVPFGAPFPATNELEFLKRQKEVLQSQLKEIEKRLKELEG